MGAYLNVMSALDLNLHLSAKGDVGYEASRNRVDQLPNRISLTDHPQLKALAWHVQGLDQLTPLEAHGLYQRNGRFIEQDKLGESERQLIAALELAFEDAGRWYLSRSIIREEGGWDEGNARKSYDRHNVSPAESEQIFFNFPLLV